MPTPGLSLVGFMDQQQALIHLRGVCIPADASDFALTRDWYIARSKLGPLFPDAGTPDIHPIAGPDREYIESLLAESWVQVATANQFTADDFQMVEIAPLLAFQTVISIDRSNHHCAPISSPSTSQILPICLPSVQPSMPPNTIITPITDTSNSVIIKTRDLNMQADRHGVFAMNAQGHQSWVAGKLLQMALPFTHVVKFNDRYYLHNGFHRALGIAKSGASHMPCLVREVATAEEAGIKIEGPELQTFPQRILESLNPPTVGHFVQDRAHEVALRSVSRIITISWSQTILPDEYDQALPSRP